MGHPVKQPCQAASLTYTITINCRLGLQPDIGGPDQVTGACIPLCPLPAECSGTRGTTGRSPELNLAPEAIPGSFFVPHVGGVEEDRVGIVEPLAAEVFVEGAEA